MDDFIPHIVGFQDGTYAIRRAKREYDYRRNFTKGCMYRIFDRLLAFEWTKDSSSLYWEYCMFFHDVETPTTYTWWTGHPIVSKCKIETIEVARHGLSKVLKWIAENPEKHQKKYDAGTTI